MSNLPVFSDTVVQSFFVEAQGGAQNPISLLDRFPDAVYSKSIDSILVRFMYALLGPAGIGQLRKEYLEARLAFEDAGLAAADLDMLYTNPFAFARLADETYDWDASAALLSAAEREQMLTSDASFRSRAITYFKGIRAGGTLLGLTLIAASGLNRPVELIENYRALYDQYCDLPLNLPYYGRTVDTNEVIVLPRQDIPRNAAQQVTVTGNPSDGWFTLVMPVGTKDQVAQNYRVVQITLDNTSVVTVLDATVIPPGVYVSIGPEVSSDPLNPLFQSPNDVEPTHFAMAGQQLPTLDGTKVQLEYLPTSVDYGQPYNPGITGTYWAYVGYCETVPIAYNSSPIALQNALQALPGVGNNNVLAIGGPLSSFPIEVQFYNDLGDQPVPPLLPNTDPYPNHINGIGTVAIPELEDVDGHPLIGPVTVTEETVGVSADSQTSALRPADEHAMQIGLDNVRPQTCFFTTVPAPGTTQRQPIQNVFAGSSYTEVLRYETGRMGVLWPQDATHWVRASVEREAPCPANNKSQHYQGFHNIIKVTAYNESALIDREYSAGIDYTRYWDTQIGNFSPFQVALYPFLGNYTNSDINTFKADKCVADAPEPLIITQNVGGTSVINDIYPSDYMGLAGQLASSNPHFWASPERIPPGMDYLEIDLGHVQPVNYVYFEATRKPFAIFVDYDLLDQAPARRFAPVQLVDPPGSHSITNLTYEPTATNPWVIVEIHCGTQLQQMIYTRYLRVGFQRTPGRTPFAPNNSPFVPYSIEVRNLRVGRNVV